MMDKALALVVAERHRQIEKEGWTPEHDDNEHRDGGPGDYRPTPVGCTHA